MSEETENKEQPVVKERIPFRFVGVFICVATVPLSFVLGNFNFALWVCFVVWAQYFLYGANPSSIKIIAPSFFTGATFGLLWSGTGVLISILYGNEYAMWGSMLGALFAFIMLTMIQNIHILNKGSLAVFNGMSMIFAIFYTGSYPAVGPLDNPFWCLFWAWIWTLVMALVGWLLGYFHIMLTFPKNIERATVQSTGIKSTASTE